MSYMCESNMPYYLTLGQMMGAVSGILIVVAGGIIDALAGKGLLDE